MPWMVFYQQSSVVEKKLSLDDLPAARLDTAFGAVVTQIIMASVLIATAATVGGRYAIWLAHLIPYSKYAQAILPPYLGETTGKLLFGLGLSGAAVVATIVVTLTAARNPSVKFSVRSIHSGSTNHTKPPGSTASIRQRLSLGR